MNSSKYQNFYQKYRPQKFSEIRAQKEVVSILIEQIIQNKTHHAYIFSGLHGVGKTSTARIFARSIVCEENLSGEACGSCKTCSGLKTNSIDIKEIDAASNNGVEEIRSLQEKIFIAPAIAAKKIWIIDEVHMFSRSAFNAFLKILEEPPKHVIFILATTEPQKIPLTVLSRCQIFNFFPLNVEEMNPFLLEIAKKEGIDIEKEAAQAISIQSRGSVRSALNVLEQMFFLQKGREITKKDISLYFGEISEDIQTKFIDSLITKNIEEALKICEKLSKTGVDLIEFASSLIKKINFVLIQKAIRKNQALKEKEKEWDLLKLKKILNFLVDDFFSFINQRINTKTSLEIILFRICLSKSNTKTIDQPQKKAVSANSEEELLKILQKRDLDLTKKVMNQWKNLAFYSSQKDLKEFIEELESCNIICCSSDSILLKSLKKSSVEKINLWRNERKFSEFLKLFFGIKMRLFALTEPELKNLKKKFNKN